MTLAGIFVGGAARRMGGRPKGLLPAPGGGTLIARWCGILGALGIDAVLVGRRDAYAPAAANLKLEFLDDEPSGVGPLGGLAALLHRAHRAGAGATLALACDMPFVPQTLVERLLAAPPAAIVAPRRDGRWEPLCARYDATAVLPVIVRRIASTDHSLQRLVGEVHAAELPITADETALLRDWDTLEDLQRG